MLNRIVAAIVSGIITGVIVYVIGLLLVAIGGNPLADWGAWLKEWAWLIGVLSGLLTLAGVSVLRS